MSGLMQDVRFACRTVAKSPVFVLTAVVSLALGVGVNTAIYSIMHTMLSWPVSARNPQELAAVTLRSEAGPMLLNYSEFQEFRKRTRAFAGVMALAQSGYRISGQGRPEFVNAIVATPGFFAVFGHEPFLGRGFSQGPQAGGEAVLSYGFWKRRFGADPAVVGKPLVLHLGAGRRTYTVVGVMPRDFRPSATGVSDLLLPFAEGDPAAAGRDARMWTLWGRVAPGVSMAQAQAATEVLAKQLASLFPESFGKARVNFAPKVRQGPAIAAARAVVHAVVGLVLLIACANVTNLLLARHESRRTEMATRLALGASRARLMRQLLMESLMLAIPSALAGLGFAALTLHVVENIRIPGLRYMTFYFPMDRSVLAFAACAAVAASIAAGLWPARVASRPDLVPVLKGAGAGFAARKFGMRGALVAAQLAVSVVGISAAGMLTKGVWDLTRYDSGVDPARVLVAVMSPQMNGYTEARTAEFRRRLAARLAAQPGVHAVTFAARVPGGGSRQEEVLNPGSALLPRHETVRVPANPVAPGFFRALGIQVLRGREYAEADVAGPARCIVNEAMARRFWPGQEPLGQMVRVGGARGVDHTVIGVAGNTEYEKAPGDNEYAPFLYLPMAKSGAFAALIRTDGAATSYAEKVRQAVAALDPDLPLFSVEAFTDALAGGPNGVELRLRAGMIGTLGGITVVLSSLGLYGVVSYLVTRRTREIGIRLALGARRGDILGAVLRDAARLAGAGLAAGLALSMVVSPLLVRHLFGVKPNDPLVIAATCLFLIAVAAAATCIPARRACKVEAMTALRYE